MAKSYDFSGWATKNDLLCSDGRTIRKNAFKHCDGQTVPLVWNHIHNDPYNILGHALLENRDDGVYTYCSFNDTPQAQICKEEVIHGDLSALSIFANKLKQDDDKNVLHGVIREVSLVLAGANPGACIETVIAHSDDEDEEAIIYTGDEITLNHSDDDEDEDEEEIIEVEEDDEETEDEDESDEEPDEDEEFEEEDEEEEINHADGGKNMAAKMGDKTIGDIVDTMTEEQKNVMYYLIDQALKEKTGGSEMKQNAFDQDTDDMELMHAEALETILADGKRYGTLKESFLEHSGEYGIEQIDWLFPEAKTLNNPPEFIKRDMGWVTKVMNGVKKSPFSRIKSVFADITEDEARAKGYMKGTLKKEEVFSLLKRTTTPTTIYKKQKLDRDDVIDITDFEVVSWLKAEMRMMLDEEIARAILIGDGRLNSADDKIKEDNIRPIAKDAELYTVQVHVTTPASATDQEKAKALVKAIIKNRKEYKGSGNPTFFTTEDVLTDMLLIEDSMGHLLYDSVEKLARVLRVSEIVTVEVMENAKSLGDKPLLGIMVNLTDYNVGADKGGSVNMFDDFDIDYNQQKYLIETRCSGALIKPKSALAFDRVES